MDLVTAHIGEGCIAKEAKIFAGILAAIPNKKVDRRRRGILIVFFIFFVKSRMSTMAAIISITVNFGRKRNPQKVMGRLFGTFWTDAKTGFVSRKKRKKDIK